MIAKLVRSNFFIVVFLIFFQLSTAAYCQTSRSVEDLQQLVEQLELRVETMKAMDAVENLQRMYGYYVDKKMWSAAADLFSEDGRFEMAQRGVYVGRERIRSMLHTLIGPEGIRHGELFNHLQVQPIITIAPDGLSANMRVRSVSQTGKRGEEGVWSGGVYENKYINVDGVWKIKSLHFYNTFAGKYEGGWTQNHLPVPGVSDEFPPDLPPSETFQMFPQTYLPPYHYRNPVTGLPIINPIDGKEAMQ